MFRRPDIGIDLGTSKFSICVRGEGIVVSEPAFIAWQGPSFYASRIIAIGAEAEAMWGKSPPGITVVCPMGDGVIRQVELASLLLKGLAKKAGLLRVFSKRRTLVATLLGASSIEKRAFLDVASSLQASRVTTIDEPLAAAIGSMIPIDEAFAQLIVDVGSGATEAIVVSKKKIVSGKSIRIGGKAMELAIINHVQRSYGIQISELSARTAKEALGSLLKGSDQLTLRGIESTSRMPRSLLLGGNEILCALQASIEKIVNLVRSMLAEIDPEMAADLIENGITLCGGGALTSTLKEVLMEHTGIEVRIVDEPSAAVARGCYSVLDFIDLVY